jgi:hypothetical protein
MALTSRPAEAPCLESTTRRILGRSWWTDQMIATWPNGVFWKQWDGCIVTDSGLSSCLLLTYRPSKLTWILRPLHNPLPVIASVAKTQFVRIDELDELHVRPAGEGQGGPESIPASWHSQSFLELPCHLRLLLRNFNLFQLYQAIIKVQHSNC